MFILLLTNPKPSSFDRCERKLYGIEKQEDRRRILSERFTLAASVLYTRKNTYAQVLVNLKSE